MTGLVSISTFLWGLRIPNRERAAKLVHCTGMASSFFKARMDTCGEYNGPFRTLGYPSAGISISTAYLVVIKKHLPKHSSHWSYFGSEVIHPGSAVSRSLALGSKCA